MNYYYDIETYKAAFTFTAVNDDNEVFQYECSARKNEVGAMFDLLDRIKHERADMVGFNNIGFDYPVIHALLGVREKAVTVSGKAVADKAYRVAQTLINADDKFEHGVAERDWYVPQIDLYKIWHFDNNARATSLKALEFNMRMNDIQEMPFPFDAPTLEDWQIEKLLAYNLHDVNATRMFADKTIKHIAFRNEITQKYGRSFVNHNDTKIGKDYFIMRLEEAGVQCYTRGRSRKPIQTVRDSINLGECLFNYYDFQRPEFIAVLDWFRNQTITETKGVFKDIKEHDLGSVAQYAALTEKRKKVAASFDENEISPLAWKQTELLKAKRAGQFLTSTWVHWRVADTLNVMVDGFRFDFGTGGIHGSVENTVVKADDEYIIVDADVASMYPNIAIANRVYPAHLGEQFCDIYQDVYEQRKSFPKGSAENAMLKLALNGVYGDSNNKYSPFYDPAYTMSITINGQLSLCLLAEKLLGVQGLKIVQVNTDGITVKMPASKRQQYDEICTQWQSQTGLTLEFADYSAMYIRDVNNYLAVYTSGKVKRKGAYQYEDLGWHQDHSALVVPMAAEAYMLHGTPLRKFIMEHDDIFDFMLRVKVNRGTRLVFVKDGVAEEQQKICRYYACKAGGKLVKMMPPLANSETGEDRAINVAAEWNVKVCNNMATFGGDIDAAFYVEQAKKLVIEN